MRALDEKLGVLARYAIKIQATADGRRTAAW